MFRSRFSWADFIASSVAWYGFAGGREAQEDVFDLETDAFLQQEPLFLELAGLRLRT